MLTQQCERPADRTLLTNPVTPEAAEVAEAVITGLGWYAGVKRLSDLVAASILLLAGLPVLAAAALLVKWTSRGPVLYGQVRLGRYGRHYTLFKLRTMIHDCEKVSGPVWSKPGDPRITPIGRFLRKSHLDELPQLFNVLRGEMSLVGPRPERPELAGPLSRALPKYQERLAVKPGLTGLAQVQLPADTDLTSVRRKLVLDRHYVRHVSWWMDLKILFATLPYLCGVPYDLLRQVFNFPAVERLDPTVPAATVEPARSHAHAA